MKHGIVWTLVCTVRGVPMFVCSMMSPHLIMSPQADLVLLLANLISSRAPANVHRGFRWWLQVTMAVSAATRGRKRSCEAYRGPIMLLAVADQQSHALSVQVPFVANSLKNVELALKIASRGDLPGAETLFVQKFETVRLPLASRSAFLPV